MEKWEISFWETDELNGDATSWGCGWVVERRRNLWAGTVPGHDSKSHLSCDDCRLPALMRQSTSVDDTRAAMLGRVPCGNVWRLSAMRKGLASVGQSEVEAVRVFRTKKYVRPARSKVTIFESVEECFLCRMSATVLDSEVPRSRAGFGELKGARSCVEYTASGIRPPSLPYMPQRHQ